MNNKKSILIVDDIELNREALATSLENEYNILKAVDGLDAIKAVKKSKHPITIILLDIVMPKMDGIEFLKWLSKSEYSNIPVVAITSDESYQLEALKNGAWDFIAKPTNNEIIKARMNNVLARYALNVEIKRSTAATKAKLQMDNLINSIPGGIAIYKVTDHFETIYFSDGVAALSGYTREEYVNWIKDDAANAIYAEDKKRLLSSALETIKSGKPIDETYRIYHKNGSLVWVNLNGVLIGKENGAYIMHAVFQKPSRMAQLYDNLVNESQNLIYVSDLHNYDLLYVNKTGLKAIGKDTADYSSKKCYEFLFGQSSPCKFCKIDNMSSEHFLERDFTYQKTGCIYSMRGKLTDWNGIPAHVEYIQDVTEKRKTELQNEALTKQLQSVMENIPSGMCVYRYDTTGFHPLVHNHAFFDIFGYSSNHQEDILKETNFLNVHPDDLDSLKNEINKVILTNGRMSYTYRCFNDLKSCYIWINLSAVIVSQPNGEKLCYVSYIDVTKEREIQEKLIEAQKILDDLRKQSQDTLENYKALVNAIPSGIVQYEVKDGKVFTRYFSDGMCELIGYQRDEREIMKSHDVLSVTYSEDLPMLNDTIKNAVLKHDNINITYRICTKSGMLRWVHLSAAFSLGKNGETFYQAVFTDVDKLKKIEQDLQENQLRYEVAIKSSGINIWEYDIQKDSLYVVSNSARIKQNCFHIENYIESTLQRGYVREDSIKSFLSIFERLKKGEKEITEDIWYKTTDEAGWWCERATYTTTFDNNGKPLKAFGAGRDVTREKEAEKKFYEEISYRKVMQSENLASNIIDLTNNKVVETDSKFKSIMDLNNDTADNYFKNTENMIAGEENRKKYHEMFNRTMLLHDFSVGEFIISTELTRLYDDNRVYWVNYNTHLMQNPETKNIIAHISCVDVTEEKVMQTIMKTVAKTDYDFFVVVDGISDSAKDYADASNRYLYDINKSFEEQNEKWIRGCVSKEDIERVIAECKINTTWDKIKDGNQYKFNFSMRETDGTIRRKQIQFTAISEVRKTYLMSRIDVTNIYNEQETARNKLRKALLDAEQANRVKTDFLSRMSHDIRTPMNAVISLATLGLDSENIEETKEYLKKIGTSGQYLLAIINDVLNLSKMENHGLELHPEVVYLPKFIQETLAIVIPTANAKQIDLRVNQSGIVSKYMKFDSTYVRQVAVNLLSNAIKFTPNGGRVELTLENLSRDGKFVKNRMYVKDNGIGISEEFLPKIFSPFEQENTQNDISRQGTGLGLSIVKAIVEQMKGKVWVESKQGVGSTFYVEWLLETLSEKDAEIIKTENVPTECKSLSGIRVLLAEDHPLNAEIAQKILSKKGILVEHTVDGQATVEQFSKSANGYYDAILMDIRMPIMNGLDATRKIRELKHPDAKTIPIIAMTANAFDEDKQKSIQAGMNAHLAKPIDPQKLYNTLESLIKNK